MEKKMTNESYTEKQLFDMLISQSVYGVWIALGKMKNPVTDKTEVDLRSASLQIDMLEMINSRMEASLDENEKQYIDKIPVSYTHLTLPTTPYV